MMILPQWPADAWLQQVAMEMNLSETAFLVRLSRTFDLRWFTPKSEVDLCGHATLAAAKVLSSLKWLLDGSSVTFSTRSGKLIASQSGERYQLDFPVKPATASEPPVGLIEALGVTPLLVGKNDFDYLVEVASADQVRAIRPDFKALAGIECRGIIVTAGGDLPGTDFVSRFFAPAEGIDEDPVTGSAHCCLADFWGRRLGKQQMTGRQLSPRGGDVEVEIQADRVLLRGSAVIVAKGEFLVPMP